jgi:endonuclease I
MKKIRNGIGLLVMIIAALIYVSQTYLDIDLVGLVIPDTEAPIIDTTELKEVVSQDGVYDTSGISCTDNRDVTCEYEIFGEIDTSIIGEQTITVTAIDAAGNETTQTITVEVIAGLNTAMYVPSGYYDGIEDLTGDTLKDRLNDIITGHTEYPYTSTSTDVWDMLRDADEDPNNADNVILFYSGYSWPKECQDTNKDLLPDYCFEGNDRDASYTEWNREHIWSKSRGDFGDDGLTAHNDAHHLVPAERVMNSIKNNRLFEDCHDGDDTNVEDRGYGNYTCNDWEFEPRDEVKGDVARMLFYMAVRYEGEDGDYVDLELANDADASKDSFLPLYGDLDDLLRWHLEDPVSEWEIERNETIYQYQGNRNPFIDYPELVELIWGSAEDYE